MKLQPGSNEVYTIQKLFSGCYNKIDEEDTNIHKGGEISKLITNFHIKMHMTQSKSFYLGSQSLI